MSKRAAALYAKMPAEIRGNRECIQNWVAWTIGRSFFVPVVQKLADELVKA